MILPNFFLFCKHRPVKTALLHNYSDDLPPHLVRLRIQKSKALKGVDFSGLLRDTVPDGVVGPNNYATRFVKLAKL